MTHKINLILLFWTLLASPQLAACAGVQPSYPIQDTGLHADRSRHELVWLDNHRLRFYGYRAAEPQGPEFHGVPRLIGADYYIWDTDANRVVADPSLEGAMRVCVQGEVLTFLRKSPTDPSKRLVVTREKGQETVTPLVNPEWFNRFSCRYYDQKPEWDHGHLSLPLLDEHGSLFWNGGISGRNTPIVFYPSRDTKGAALPISTREAWPGLTRYVPFQHAYLLWGYSYIDKKTGTEFPYIPPDRSQTVWWLAPDGQVTEQAIPMRSWMRKQEYYAIRDGLFVASRGITDLGNPGVAGGYILKPGTEQKLIIGLLEDISVSPDGCQVAFLHDPYTAEPFYKRFYVKIINVCREVHHAR